MAEEERQGEGFLARWSRLKRSGGQGDTPREPPAATAPLPARAAATPPLDPPPAPAASAVAAEAAVDPATLPPVESLTAASDFTVFLRKGVPAALRSAALRRAWTLDPTIRDFVGPADYAWDWNTPGGAPGYAAQIASGPDVEALADRILGLVREPATPGPKAEAPHATAVAAPAPAPDRSPEPPEPAPVRLSDGRAAAQDAEEEGTTRAPDALPAEAGPARPAPRPRHGGAMPA